MSNQLKNYTNQLLKKIKKRRVYSAFKNNVWETDLAGKQLIRKFNKCLCLLTLCVIDIFNKYGWVVPLNDKKVRTIINTFQKILDNSTKLHSLRKPNKIWVAKGSEFYNSFFLKKWYKDNDTEMYSTYNEGKSVVAGRFIRTLTLYRPRYDSLEQKI